MRIDRCLCHGTAFAALAEAARQSGAETVAELQASGADFGHGCGLCHPYVRRMLRTGEVVFREVVTETDEPERPC
ncbi:MAG TPA: (2Fe-2S)-binding protein [Bacteroidetes bacterium]|nr:(2Fe-2S)-binding protein [Bacteroidota bacterium]HIL58716.1 (2Fe-2S)-binding protein [Rhodothermales bacterium]